MHADPLARSYKVLRELNNGVMMLTSVMRHTPVKASHILMVLSRDPEMRNGPGAGPPFFLCKVSYVHHTTAVTPLSPLP